MSLRSIGLDERLYRYVLDVSLREPGPKDGPSAVRRNRPRIALA